jgi:DNA-directed RNA polymerase specialized sigma24 family protein
VELLAAYSNRPELLRPLADVLRRVEPHEHERDGEVKSRARTWSTSDRLAPAGIDTLIELFLDGTPKTQLAAKFGISLSSVKRLLRQRRVRR